MTAPLTVVIPVGPYLANKRWLPEALASVKEQTLPPDEVLIIDDMSGMDEADLLPFIEPGVQVVHPAWPAAQDSPYTVKLCRMVDGEMTTPVQIYAAPWHLGVAHAFNFGVALARNDLVFMLGSDDYLAKDCIERSVAAWERNKRADGYYCPLLEYLDDRAEKQQDQPCGAAMVTKGLWRYTGGFPTQAAVGASDTMLISILWKHRPDLLVKIPSPHPLYYYRPHDESDTARAGPWQGIIFDVRDKVTALWEPRWVTGAELK